MIFRISVWILFLFGGATAGILLDKQWFPQIWNSLSFHIVSFVIGSGILRTVIIVSRNTGRTLAQYGREGKLRRMETNRLVRQGPYGCMRHPMHLGLFLFPLSVAFLTGSFSFIVLIAPAEILLMIIMVFLLEEREAIKKFGDEYLRYKKEVPAFSLKPSCLKLLFKHVERNKDRI